MPSRLRKHGKSIKASVTTLDDTPFLKAISYGLIICMVMMVVDQFLKFNFIDKFFWNSFVLKDTPVFKAFIENGEMTAHRVGFFESVLFFFMSLRFIQIGSRFFCLF